MKRRTYLPLLAGALLLGGCGDITVPDYADPPLEDLITNPTVGAVLQAATGVLQGTRQDADTYVRITGITGREGYFLDPNEGRYVTNIYAGNPNRSNFTGASYWTTPYRNIRTASILIDALDQVDMPAADEAAIRGMAKTIQAVDYLQLLNTREEIPIQVTGSLDSLTIPDPILPRAEVFAFISNLLDEAAADLQNAGSSFPFPMPSGFTEFGFDQPAMFLQFNRALKARVEVYRATRGETIDVSHYNNALAALEQSFITTGGAVNPLTDRSLLNLGVYQTYSNNSGDTENTLFDPSGKTVAEPTLRDDAELRANGEPDARFVLKTEPGPTTTVRGLSSDLRFTLYSSRPFFGPGGESSPIPIIRNEELILLRSEARWFTGDRVGATADLNFIRQFSGGLEPIPVPASDDAYVDELLRQRRYSLLFEGGHRWIDHRRFGRLAELQASVAPRVVAGAPVTSDKVAEFFPLPRNETAPRT